MLTKLIYSKNVNSVKCHIEVSVILKHKRQIPRKKHNED